MAFATGTARLADTSSDWRVPRAATEAQQQQQFLAQQQSTMYQYQMALQALNLQTVQMQERLIAQMTQTVQQEIDPPTDDDLRQRRFAALSNLQRAQQNRTSPEPEPRTANRLSFNGTESFLEQAVARRTGSSPPDEQPSFIRGHVRSASSTDSSQSIGLSESNKRMTSPSTGLTLVLSQPGDSFPSPTLDRSIKRLSIRTPPARSGSGSDSSSSSPRTPASEHTSESFSFESVTSVHTDDGKDASLATRLNPSAPAFNPVRHVSAPLFRPASPLAKPVRQPKGPCSDEQLATLNFAGRVRARAFNQMKSRLRATSPVAAVFSL